MLASCHAVLEVQPGVVLVQVIISHDDFPALGDGNGDLVIVYRHDVEYDGIFSVKELELFQIELVFHVKTSLQDLVPDGILDFDLSCVVSRAFTARVSRFKLDLADLIVSALELAVTTGHGMAIFDAILEYADIRIAFLAHTGGDKIAVGDKPDSRHLRVSKPIQPGNAVHYLLHLYYLRIFDFAFFRQGDGRAVCKRGEGIILVVLGASTEQREIVACKSLKNKKEPKPEYPISTLFFV